jgi:hypothetical protein
VSEPLNDVADYWEEISESSVIVVEGSDVSQRPFRPERPA